MIAKPSIASWRPSEPIARLIVAAIAVLMAAVRVPLLSVMHRPGINWDEMTYLNFARIFAGAGPPLDLRVDPNVEHAGYGLVIAPAFVLHAPFEIAYHLVLGINLILGLCLTLLAYRIARRVAGASRPIAILSAVALTAYPAFFVLPLFVFSENVVFPLMLLCVLAFYEMVETPKRAGWHAAFALSVVGMWFAHAPSAVIVALAFASLLCLALMRRISALYATADAIVMLAGVAIAQRVHEHLWPLSWGPANDTKLIPGILAGISSLLLWLGNSLHVLVYEQAAIVLPSLGLYILVMVVLTREVFVARRGPWTARALTCCFVIAATLGMSLMSATFVATFPGALSMPDVLFATRYPEQGIIGALAIGLPLFFTYAIRMRPFAYYGLAGIVVAAFLAAPDYNGSIYLQPGESISELSWSGFAGLLHGSPMIVLAVFALAVLAGILWLRRDRPVVALLAITCVWLACSAADVKRQIAPEQANYDQLLGASSSRLSPYVRAMPQFNDVAVALNDLNIFTYNQVALDVPDHRFTLATWPRGSGPIQDAAIARSSPNGFTEIACETFPPVTCLYVRDQTTAAYLRKWGGLGAFEPHPTFALGRGLEIGIDTTGLISWQGVYPLEKTPNGLPFRWTNGSAHVVLPYLTEPASIAAIDLVAPNPGHITIELQRPGRPPQTITNAADVTNLNSYSVSVAPYAPGTSISIRTTNVQPGSEANRRLSVEIRSFRLLR